LATEELEEADWESEYSVQARGEQQAQEEGELEQEYVSDVTDEDDFEYEEERNEKAEADRNFYMNWGAGFR
jgi:hypothetical protein